jgi:hypothetical protein
VLPLLNGVVASSAAHSATEVSQAVDQDLPGIGVHEASDLDSGITLDPDFSIEPEYGFADDALGSVSISVLVTPEGKAAMVWHAPSDLDKSAIAYMTNALRVVRYSQPRKNGFPAYGIFRIQVDVGNMGERDER